MWSHRGGRKLRWQDLANTKSKHKNCYKNLLELALKKLWGPVYAWVLPPIVSHVLCRNFWSLGVVWCRMSSSPWCASSRLSIAFPRWGQRNWFGPQQRNAWAQTLLLKTSPLGGYWWLYILYMVFSCFLICHLLHLFFFHIHARHSWEEFKSVGAAVRPFCSPNSLTNLWGEEFSALVALQFRLQEVGRESVEICQVESCIFLKLLEHCETAVWWARCL